LFSLVLPLVLSSEDILTAITPDTMPNSKTFSRRISQIGPELPPATLRGTMVFLSRESTPGRSHGNKALIGGHGISLFTDSITESSPIKKNKH
jgi:hypothetical protein